MHVSEFCCKLAVVLLSHELFLKSYALRSTAVQMKYGVRTLAYTEFVDATFDGCKGECAGEDKFGRDGEDVLKSLSRVFEVVTTENTFAEDIGITLAIMAFFKVMFLFMFTGKSQKASSISSAK